MTVVERFWMDLLAQLPCVLSTRVQKDRAGADPAEWPEDLRIQDFPA